MTLILVSDPGSTASRPWPRYIGVVAVSRLATQRAAATPPRDIWLDDSVRFADSRKRPGPVPRGVPSGAFCDSTSFLRRFGDDWMPRRDRVGVASCARTRVRATDGTRPIRKTWTQPVRASTRKPNVCFPLESRRRGRETSILIFGGRLSARKRTSRA